MLFHRISINLAGLKKKTNGRGLLSSFVARFGPSKARAVGLISSGVKNAKRIDRM